MNMLNGIEVLNESYLSNGSDYSNNSNLCIFMLMGTIILFGIGLCMAWTSYSNKIKSIGVFIMICSFVCHILSIIYSNQSSDIKQYQVTISDDVSMTEFNEKYEVIKVEGKIYTIREKESK